MKINCVSCKKLIDLKVTVTTTNQKCRGCGRVYKTNEKYLKYEYEEMLKKNYTKDYLLNQVLNNNALLSYTIQKKASLSLPNRSDVLRFRDFIENTILSNLKKRNKYRVLDIGCGPMSLPGYLQFKSKLSKSSEIYGIDPIDSNSFKGYRIVGTAEYMPFTDNFIDAAIYATSLDHVCSLERAIQETYRILKTDGVAMIWMSDRSRFLKFNFKEAIENFLFYLRHGYRREKFYLASNTHLYYVPDGAVDPFHSFNETPDIIRKLFLRKNMRLTDLAYNNVNEVFLAFQKN